MMLSGPPALQCALMQAAAVHLFSLATQNQNLSKLVNSRLAWSAQAEEAEQAPGASAGSATDEQQQRHSSSSSSKGRKASPHLRLIRALAHGRKWQRQAFWLGFKVWHPLLGRRCVGLICNLSPVWACLSFQGHAP